MVDDRWYTVALPIMVWVQNNHPNARQVLAVNELAEGIGLDAENVGTEVRSLLDAGFLSGDLRTYLGGSDGAGNILSCRLTERGLRTVGAWPRDDPYDALVALLDRQIATTSDPVEKSRLTAFKSTATEVGKATIVSILTQLATGGMHL